MLSFYVYLSGNVTTIFKSALLGKLLYEFGFFLATNQPLLKTYLPQSKSSTSWIVLETSDDKQTDRQTSYHFRGKIRTQ